MIGRLLAAGVDVFRLNFSHGAQADHAQVARFIRKQAGHHGRYVGILADLQGPKIRVGGFTQGGVVLQAGDPFQLSLDIAAEAGDHRGVSVEYEALPASVKAGDILLLDDGKLRLRVDDVSDQSVDCTVLIGGRLSSRKGVNKLGGGLAAPALTEKDLDDIAAMPQIEPDFVAVSFVSSAKDIEEARRLLADQGLHPAIVAKIERAEVVADTELLNSIIDASGRGHGGSWRPGCRGRRCAADRHSEEPDLYNAQTRSYGDHSNPNDGINDQQFDAYTR